MNKNTKNHCLKCNSTFISIRNHNQEYCSQRSCQNARKSLWHKNKRSKDPDYRYNHNAACKKWREQNTDYYHKYRAANHQYTERNRQLQCKRDRNRANAAAIGDASHLAKSDALTSTPLIAEGLYRLIPDGCDLAKSDALIVIIAVIARESAGLSIYT